MIENTKKMIYNWNISHMILKPVVSKLGFLRHSAVIIFESFIQAVSPRILTTLGTSVWVSAKEFLLGRGFKWMFPKIGGNPPKWMVYNGKPY